VEREVKREGGRGKKRGEEEREYRRGKRGEGT
jgi:hypothetical protein